MAKFSTSSSTLAQTLAIATTPTHYWRRYNHCQRDYTPRSQIQVMEALPCRRRVPQCCSASGASRKTNVESLFTQRSLCSQNSCLLALEYLVFGTSALIVHCIHREWTVIGTPKENTTLLISDASLGWQSWFPPSCHARSRPPKFLQFNATTSPSALARVVAHRVQDDKDVFHDLVKTVSTALERDGLSALPDTASTKPSLCLTLSSIGRSFMGTIGRNGWKIKEVFRYMISDPFTETESMSTATLTSSSTRSAPSSRSSSRLQELMPDNVWRCIKHRVATLVINIGDQLSFMSGEGPPRIKHTCVDSASSILRISCAELRLLPS
uniref:K Homology domain-containing protein n=1 Tax=Mycena chlorophos TaxID=658473 RepID=A0ABQ0KVD7_MYCCL|nr:predicted protein [Mycena chlorophos]